MIPRIPTPGRKRSKSYVEKYSDSRKRNADRDPPSPNSSLPKLQPSKDPLKFAPNEPAPSPHRTGFFFVVAVLLLALTLLAFLLWMQTG